MKMQADLPIGFDLKSVKSDLVLIQNECFDRGLVQSAKWYFFVVYSSKICFLNIFLYYRSVTMTVCGGRRPFRSQAVPDPGPKRER